MAEQLHRCGIGEVQVQPLGVDLEAFQPQRAKPNARRALGISDHQHLLVFAGRGTQEKNIPVLLKAMRELGPDYHLLLIGTGLQADAPANVSVIHEFCPTPEVAGWMAAADGVASAPLRSSVRQSSGSALRWFFFWGTPRRRMNASGLGTA